MRRTRTRSNPFRLLIPVLAAVLVALCLFAVFGELALSDRPDAGTIEETIWLYAKENGLRLSDYPQSLIELLRKNPETEKFVLEYPIAKDVVPVIDMSPYLNAETVPLFMQWDQRWGYIPYGSDVAGLTGCGPTCLSMAAIFVTGDPTFSPDYMLNFALENNYYVPGSGSSWTLISQGGPKLGLEVQELPLDEGRIRKALDAGKPVICAMGPGDFTSSGHFIVIAGMENGQFRINDPNSLTNSQKLWAYDTIKSQIRNLWSIGAGQ